MRFIALIAALCASTALMACGESGTTAAEKSRTPVPFSYSTNDRGQPTSVVIPPGPPPKRLVVKDLKKGTGAVLRHKADISTYFVAFDYDTGKPREVYWKRPFSIHFGPGWEVRGWEKGLPGMRVGGIRELIVPSRLAYKDGARVYVVKLLGLELG